MSKDKTGGPAFPCDLTMYDKEVQVQMQGMTLRDYFAAKAMQGICARVQWSYSGAAKDAYEYADAMLRARALQGEANND
jgi:hypothetical protein